MNRIFQILLFCTLSFLTAGFAHAFTAERPVMPDFDNLDMQDDLSATGLALAAEPIVLIALQDVQSIHADAISPEPYIVAGNSQSHDSAVLLNQDGTLNTAFSAGLQRQGHSDFTEALSTCDAAAMTGARGQGHLKAASLKPASTVLRIADRPRAYALKQPDLYSG